MRKVTEEMKSEMKRLRSEGKRYSEIGKILNVRPDSVSYHTDERVKERVKATIKRCQNKRYAEGRSWYHNNREKALEIMRKCNHKRYHNDEEFKQKMIAYATERHKRLYGVDPEYTKKKKASNRRWYHKNKEKLKARRMRQCDANKREEMREDKNGVNTPKTE